MPNQGMRASASTLGPIRTGRICSADVAQLSKTTIYREIRKNRFPRPMEVSRGRVMWKLADVLAWKNGLQTREYQAARS